ncbi:hypothetical protein BH09PSE5_BH09PSE5_42280 [soil metagenome]
MGFADAVLHVLNFFAPAAGVGMIAAFLTKLLWRRELKSVGWTRLATWAFVACAVVSIAGLLILGRDGTMSTYAVMVAASAGAIWFAAWGKGRKS